MEKKNLSKEIILELNKTLLGCEIAKEFGYTAEQFRGYCYRNKIKLIQRNGRERHPDSRSYVINEYKYSAKKRGHSFELTEDQFFSIVVKPCTYCGRQYTNTMKWSRHQPHNAKQKADFKFTGVDRVDSLKGYTLENSVPCCKICNIAKSNLTLNEFKEWIRELIKHNI